MQLLWKKLMSEVDVMALQKCNVSNHGIAHNMFEKFHILQKYNNLWSSISVIFPPL